LATSGRVTTVVPHDLIARMMAQACHQPGISEVYKELLTFEGDDIQFASVPELEGHTYNEALLALDRASLLGIRTAHGEIVLAPEGTRRFAPGDDAIAIASARADVRYTGFRDVADALEDLGVSIPAVHPPRGHTLVAGWNSLGPVVLGELDRSMAAGSTVTVALDHDHSEHDALARVGAFDHIAVDVVEIDFGRPDSYRRVLGARPVDNLVVLCYRSGVAAPAADARALITLLTLRQELERSEARKPGIVIELLDLKDSALISEGDIDDFLVSDAFTAMVMAQLALAIDVRRVLATILDAADVNIALRPASDFVPLETDLEYAIVVAAAARGAETVLGYRRRRDGAASSLHINPRKDATVRFTELDDLIVVCSPRG
jgi:hypothetical protein